MVFTYISLDIMLQEDETKGINDKRHLISKEKGLDS